MLLPRRGCAPGGAWMVAALGAALAGLLARAAARPIEPRPTATAAVVRVGSIVCRVDVPPAPAGALPLVLLVAGTGRGRDEYPWVRSHAHASAVVEMRSRPGFDELNRIDLLDLAAALRARFPSVGRATLLAGHSFGAVVAQHSALRADSADGAEGPFGLLLVSAVIAFPAGFGRRVRLPLVGLGAEHDCVTDPRWTVDYVARAASRDRHAHVAPRATHAGWAVAAPAVAASARYATVPWCASASPDAQARLGAAVVRAFARYLNGSATFADVRRAAPSRNDSSRNDSSRNACTCCDPARGARRVAWQDRWCAAAPVLVG